MGKLMILLWVLVAVVVVVLGYIRLAPSDPLTWHMMPETTTEREFGNGLVRQVEAGPDGLAKLDRIMAESPRSKWLAGSVQDGMVTYVSRSAIMGYPDYTTVRQEGEVLTIYARARFGRSDFGVNRTRVQRWVDALQAG